MLKFGCDGVLQFEMPSSLVCVDRSQHWSGLVAACFFLTIGKQQQGTIFIINGDHDADIKPAID